MLSRLLRLVLALLPLAAGLYLLRLLPEAATAASDAVAQASPASLWRLDPLALAGLLLLSFPAAWPQPSLVRALRLLTGVAGVGAALAAADPMLQLLLLYGVSAVLLGGLGPNWFLALAAVSFAHFLPEAAEAGWLRASAARSLGPPALMLGALIGLGCAPLGARRGGPVWEVVVRPFWLFPLLRSLQAGSWPAPWSLVVPLLGALAALGLAVGALSSTDSQSGTERILLTVLAMALVCSGLSSAVGIAGALWALLAHGLLFLHLGAGRRGGSPLIVILLLFLAAWWTAAAAAAARGFAVAGMVWWAGMAAGVAPIWWRRTSAPSEQRAIAAVAAPLLTMLLFIGYMLGGPVATRFVALPVIAQLDPGLTPHGLLELWPWIGAGALDAGHGRAAVLPTLPLLALWGVLLSLVWLGLRARPHGGIDERPEPAAEPDGAGDPRDRLWWAPRRRHG